MSSSFIIMGLRSLSRPSSSLSSFGGSRTCRKFSGYTTADPSLSFRNFVSRPNFIIAAKIAFSGSPMIKEKSRLDFEEFMAGALTAVEIVSDNVASNRLSEIADLLHPECYSSLKTAVKELDSPPDPIHVDEIFFSWVALVLMKKDLFQIKTVTMSHAGVPLIKSKSEELLKTVRELRERADARDSPDVVAAKIEEAKELNLERVKAFESSEIMVSNFTFEQHKKDGPWIISEISVLPSKRAYTPLGYHYWKMRLKLALFQNVDFLKVLRFDYATNFVIFFSFCFMVLTTN